MSSKITRRIFILQVLSLLAACQSQEKPTGGLELVLGVISYGEEKQALEQFTNLRQYLGDKIGSIIQLEPAFNENVAIERVKRNSWSLVFATPGLAALATYEYKYQALFPLQTNGNSRSVIVVRKDSGLKELKDLQGKIVALGLPGSATGYYVPLYNLYGLILAEILFTPTPKKILELVAENQADAGAVSLEEFNALRNISDKTEFTILFSDYQNIPPGAVLISPEVEKPRQDLIRKYLREAPPNIIKTAGYSPNSQPPNYKYMMTVVKRVIAITGRINSKPVRVF